MDMLPINRSNYIRQIPFVVESEMEYAISTCVLHKDLNILHSILLYNFVHICRICCPQYVGLPLGYSSPFCLRRWRFEVQRS